MPARILACGVAATALLAASGAFAQDEATQVEEAVITATRIEVPRAAVAATIQVIGGEEIEAQTALGFSAVDTVASLVPSFSPTRQKLSGFGETLRGRSPLYLIDGVPQSTPLRDDSRDGFTLDPFFIDRVEVVFGSSAIQGIGATGGVINYVTPPTPKDGEGWSGRVLGQVSTDGGVHGDALGWKTAGRVGRDFGRVDLLVGAAYEARGAYYDAEGRRIGFDGAQGEVQDSASWSLFLKTGVDFTDSRRLELMVNHFELEGDGDYVTVPGNRLFELPTSAVRGAIQGKPTANEVTSAALTYSDSDLLGGTFRAQGFAHDYHGVFGGGTFADFQDPTIAPVGTLFDQSANNSEKLGLKLEYQRRFDFGFRVLAGLDLIRDETYQELVLTDRLWVPKTVFESAAPFVQLHQSLFDGRLHLSGGLRYESATLKVDDYQTLYAYGRPATPGPVSVAGGQPEFQETLGNLGLTFEPVEGLTAYAAFSQGFTMPDVGRVLRAIRDPGLDVDSFLDVSPVVSDNSELGLEFRHGRIELSAAYFWSTSDKGSLLVLNSGGLYEVQRQRTEIEGMEMSARWEVNDTLSVGGAYAALEGRTDSNGDGSVDRDLDGANISPDRLLFWAQLAHGPFTGRVQHQSYLERSFEGVDPRNDFDGYGVTDLIVSWKGDVATVTLGVQNLFNTQYVTYFSDTQAPTNNSRYFAGRGRTVGLTVTKDF